MRDLSERRVLAALIRFRDKIANGAKWWAYDDDTIGNKNMEVNWGLCCESMEDWPDPKDHIFPEDIKLGRSSPKYHGAYQCPLDKRWPKHDRKHASANDPINGCFWRCMYWQKRMPRNEDGSLDREEVLKLYDAKIAKMQEKLK